MLGGTFDPIHNAHIEIARSALAAASLDVVLFIIAPSPPHKQEGIVASPEQRMAMIEAALVGESHMEACDLEMKRFGPSYTATTLEQLTDLYPDSELFLILGLDSLIDLPNWRNPKTILALAHILAVSRPGETPPTDPILAGKFDLIPFEETDVSSTEVRRKIKAGEAVDQLLPASVIDVIREGRIYEP